MGLRENIMTETIGDLALRTLVIIQSDQTVREVCEALRQAKLGAAVTVDEAGRPLGMFNEKILMRILAENPQVVDEPVREYLTRSVVTVSRDDTIDTLIATMQTQKLRWVCVVDAAGKATALTGLRGVMEYVVEHFPRSVYSHPMRSKLATEEREGA